MRTFIKGAGILAFFSASIAFSLLCYDYYHTKNAFPANVFIGKVNISFLSPEEAVQKLAATDISQAFSPVITLEAEGFSFSFPPDQLGITLKPVESVSQAYAAAHLDNYFLSLKTRLFNEGERYPLALAIKEEALQGVLSALALAVQSTTKDASVVYYEETGGYNIRPETMGREMSVSKSLAEVKGALFKNETSIPLVIKYSYPRIREVDLRAHPPVFRLSAYTTYYGTHDSLNRIHNIRLVASWIDGTILLPGDQFSVARVIGDVSPERGFKEAFVIVGGQLEPLLGGGSCQIATTLYNCVALADLKILQRRNHSFYFNIYPLGRDAGVYPGQLDFRFENDTGYPLLVKAVATNKKLSFRIYGTPTGKTVEFSAPRILGRSASGKMVPMSLGQVLAYDIPFKTFVSRTVYNKDGEKIKQEEIASFYKLYGDKTNVPIRRPEPR